MFKIRHKATGQFLVGGTLDYPRKFTEHGKAWTSLQTIRQHFSYDFQACLDLWDCVEIVEYIPTPLPSSDSFMTECRNTARCCVRHFGKESE